MLIDWFTVAAQVANFLILIGLLRHFLYRPILDAIDSREQRIAGELADADARKADAGKEREEFERKNAAFDKERADLLKKAGEDANAERCRLLDEARAAATRLQASREDSLQREAQALEQEITRRTRQEVFAIARKTLSDLAGATLEARMLDVFLRRLHAASTEERQQLVAALQASATPLVVRSTFALPAEQKSAAEAAIHELIGSSAEIRFETSPDLLGGIELASDGQKVSWTIDEYLSTMEKGVGELLQAKQAPAAGTNAADAAAEPSAQAAKADGH